MDELNKEPLNDLEAFYMVEHDPIKRAKYKKYYDLRNQANEGTLTKEGLKTLVDDLFEGQNTNDPIFNPHTLYEALLPKIKSDENKHRL